MTDYLNEFTPDWPHGHVLVTSDGIARPFVVKVTDGPGEFPIWGHVVGNEGPWTYLADGSSGSRQSRLRNAAPPKREPREIWVNVYKSGYGYVHTSRAAADKQVFGHDVRNTRIKCVHFREVIEEAEPETEEGLPKRFDIEEAKAALITCADVYHALDWSSTPQGGEFWEGYFNNDLSPEDTARAREALERWITIAERRAAK